MPKSYIAAVALLAISATLQPANGSINLPTDGTWVPFDWQLAPHDVSDFVGPYSFAGQFGQIGGFRGLIPGPFVYSSTTPILLQIVDVEENGDLFEVFLGQDSRGETSTPANDGESLGDDLDAAMEALADSRWSRGSFLLPAGTHEVFIKTVLTPFAPPLVPIELTEGKGWMRASAVSGTSVPEPATIFVWAVAMLGFAVVASRKR